MNIEERVKTIDIGYNYIEVTKDEILSWGGYGVCDTCNALMNKGYLIFIKARCICPKCFDKFKDTKERLYKNDLNYQEKNSLTWYKYFLDKDFREKHKNDKEILKIL